MQLNDIGRQLHPHAAGDRTRCRRIPYPYGGKQRQVQVDLDMPALQSKGLSPADVVNTVGAQNLILPFRNDEDRPVRVSARNQQRSRPPSGPQ
jgi:hypothetical protein